MGLRTITLAFFIGLMQHAFSQTQLSGIINDYKSVSFYNPEYASFILNNTAGLSAGDTVLVIQMKGAEIKDNNNNNYGEIDEYNGAGNFELATICKIIGNEVQMTHGMINEYNSGGSVQIIKLNNYQTVEVTDTLKCDPWDGSKGGVVVIYATGIVELNAPIQVSGNGFRGGAHFISTYSCIFTDNFNDFEYDVTGGKGAWKGEGIAHYGSLTGGKGPLANGGGGGNDHNAGGGGGSNGSEGGQGGENDEPGQFNCDGYHPGLGGRELDVQGENRLFLGGGGGAGHSNAQWTTAGGNGGGMVIIFADEIIGNGQTIFANGIDGNPGIGDGAGGGGAGGTVYLHANTFTSNLTIEATGGHGADSDGFPNARCFGPGGGGSGGAVRYQQVSTPGGITEILNGGTAGVITNTTAGCLGDSLGAESGEAGVQVYSATYDFTFPDDPNQLEPVMDDLGLDTAFCKGGQLELDAGEFATNYEWSTGRTKHDLTVKSTGKYIVTVSNGGCYVTDSISITVYNAPGETPDENAEICSYLGVELGAKNDSLTYLWNTGETTQKIIVTEKGTYKVTVTGESNCENEYKIKVTVCTNELNAPNTITPNGDGNNDTWIVPGIFEFPGNVVTIFNRNGDLVYKKENYDNSWDGGNLPAATYYYTVNFNNGGNLVGGDITIVREK